MHQKIGCYLAPHISKKWSPRREPGNSAGVGSLAPRNCTGDFREFYLVPPIFREAI
jgi:hypothetical protein